MGMTLKKMVVWTGRTEEGVSLRIVASEVSQTYNTWNYYLERSTGKDAMDLERWDYVSAEDHGEYLLKCLGELMRLQSVK